MILAEELFKNYPNLALAINCITSILCSKRSCDLSCSREQYDEKKLPLKQSTQAAVDPTHPQSMLEQLDIQSNQAAIKQDREYIY